MVKFPQSGFQQGFALELVRQRNPYLGNLLLAERAGYYV